MKRFLVLICIFISYTYSNAQYLGYHFHNWLYVNYVELDDATVSTATGNDGAENINLPFFFKYMGVDYSTARISVNGWLEFGQTFTGLGYENDLASTTAKPLICPLWDDLTDDENSEIRYKTIGVSPARIFIIEWKNIIAGSSRKSFQVKLYEIDGTIEINYGPQSGVGPASASIGLNDHIGGINHFISITPNQFNPSITVANNNINSFDEIGENITYFFIPEGKEFNITTIQVTDNVISGAGNQPIIGILITSHLGVLTMPSVTSVSFSTNGTTNTNDIINAKIFNTGINPNFSDVNQTGATLNNPNENFSISGGGGLRDFSTNYLWLTYDVSPNAQIGNVLDAECYQLTFSLTFPQSPDITAPAGNRMIIQGSGLNGLYTVGDNASFPSLTAAFDSLTETFLSGPVTMELLNNYNSSVENFPLTIPFISGSSSQNNITIRPTSDANNILISGSGSSIFKFEGANYISIDGSPAGTVNQQALSIVNEDHNGSVITITDNSKNINIMNCKVLGCNTSDIKGVIESAYNGYSTFTENILISNCFIGKSFSGRPAIGIYFESGGYPAASNWIIRNCSITDFTDAGIKINQAEETFIEDSEIYLTVPTDKSNVTGIILNPGSYSTRVLRNSIHSLSTNTSTSNNVTGIEIPFTSYHSIYNNFISLAGNEYSLVTGIDFNGEYHSFNNFYNNSIHIYGNCMNSNNSYCFRRRSTQYYSGLNLELKNNIFVNKRTNSIGTGKHYSIAIEDQRGLRKIDFNDYFVSGNGGVFGRWLNNDVNNLAQWQNATQKDSSSVSKEIYFISDTDLHLAGNSLGDTDLIGEPISGIYDDIDKESRNPLYPYIGADENLEYPLPVEFSAFTVQLSSNKVILSWSTSTETNNYGFEIESRISSEEIWDRIGFVAGNGTTTEPKSYSFTDKDLLAGKYSYRLKQIDFDGSFEYSNVVEITIGIPDEFVLYQNYPNPFNPVTKIKYSIPEKSLVNLKVFDMLGREITTLVNQEKKPGIYEAEFNPDNLSSGIYLYVLKVAGQQITGKMVYQK
jgi:hypothetical protein